LIEEFRAQTLESVTVLKLLGWLGSIFEQWYMTIPLVMSLMVIAMVWHKLHVISAAMATFKRDH
jgi:hypothetical protein